MHNKRNKYNDKNRDNVPMGVRVVYTGNSPEQKMKDLEKALSKFKKILTKEGLMVELREREYFKSPSRKAYEKRRTALYKVKSNKEKEEKKRLKFLHKKRKRKKGRGGTR